MSKRNRPLSKKQRRGLQALIDQVERVRYEATNYAGARPERKEQTHETIDN